MRFITSGIFRFSYLLLVPGLCLFLFLGGCAKNKYSCEAGGKRYQHKIKKNKSNYGVQYGAKTKPVPKNYRIKNGK